ncbi:hypothetical protein [Mammaliicoccus sp. E-M21]|uniref:hypothetical protein n=1 Tax=Mammaliicoccus sp. E-M21 TaxID=2898681 RepID=UPI001EFA7385|nr:hypothetical protein [Mammaliicoccus sp. E-M21]
MKMSIAQRNVLKKQFELAFQDKELVIAFKEDYEQIYKQMAQDVLSQNGFPKMTEIKDDIVEMEIKPKSDVEPFVDYVEESGDIEDDDDFEHIRTDGSYFIEIILERENLRYTNISFRIKIDPNEYLEEHPTEQHLAKEMSKAYDENVLKKHIIEDSEFREEELREYLVDEGFSEDVDINKVKYSIDNLIVSDSFVNIAEMILDTGRFSSDDRVSRFVKRDMYKIIVDSKLYEYDFRLESDPHELEEME